jgi:hypothetical protein
MLEAAELEAAELAARVGVFRVSPQGVSVRCSYGLSSPNLS